MGGGALRESSIDKLKLGPLLLLLLLLLLLFGDIEGDEGIKSFITLNDDPKSPNQRDDDDVEDDDEFGAPRW